MKCLRSQRSAGAHTQNIISYFKGMVGVVVVFGSVCTFERLLFLITTRLFLKSSAITLRTDTQTHLVTRGWRRTCLQKRARKKNPKAFRSGQMYNLIVIYGGEISVFGSERERWFNVAAWGPLFECVFVFCQSLMEYDEEIESLLLSRRAALDVKIWVVFELHVVTYASSVVFSK